MEIVDLYNQGNSCRQIAKMLGYGCHKTVSKVLCRKGLILRDKSTTQTLRAKTKRKRTRTIYTCNKCTANVSTSKSRLCRSCYLGQDLSGTKSKDWKGGKPKCQQCSKILSSYSLKKNLCRKCHDQVKGSNHWNWTGGTKSRSLNTKEYKDWRTSVFERDNFTCQHCNVRGSKLHAHHVIQWKDSIELRFDITNGLTLCVSCHHKEHWGV